MEGALDLLTRPVRGGELDWRASVLVELQQTTQMDLRLQLVGHQRQYSALGGKRINAIWPRP